MSKPSPEVRLQKFLAEAGLASRRKAEQIIQSGRVKVNGKVVTELGTKVSPGRDLVVVDGAPVERKTARRYLMLYKPPGCVTTLSDPQGRPTARGYLTGVKERVFPVGRLDYDAEGALLFTDDGELANRLAHPSFGHRRVYLVKTKGDPDPAALRRLCEGVRLEDGPARALVAEVHEKAETNTWVKIVIGEGRNHLVKRLCESVGLPVLRLFRPEFGGVTVARLRPGRWRDLTAEEVEAMQAATSGEDEASSTRLPLPLDLPKAARRHGHGPPPQGQVDDEQPADRARDERRAREEAEDDGRGARRDGRGGGGGRAGRDERERPGRDRPREERPRYGRPQGDRPGGNRTRNDRPQSDRPRDERPRFGRPQGDRPSGSRTRNDHPRTDRPREEGPRSGRPQGDRPSGSRTRNDHPRTDRPREERPRFGRPQGDRPGGSRTRDDRPQSDRPTGDRPRTDRPRSDRPRADRPRGERPGRSGPPPRRPKR